VADDAGAEKGPAEHLPPKESEELRRQVRRRLESEYERLHGRAHAPEHEMSSADRARTERLRLIREEENAFYAERGLYRYRNHRGEYEWLTSEELADRQASRRQRRKRYAERGFFQQLIHSSLLKDVMNGLLVVVVLALVIFVFRYEERQKTEGGSLAVYQVRVRSEPAGAAIFLDGRPTRATTNEVLRLREPGEHVVSVVRPGYRTVPESTRVQLTQKYTELTLYFTLYRQAAARPPAADTTQGDPGT